MKQNGTVQSVDYLRPPRESLFKNIRKHHRLYILALPGILFFIMFRIVPSLGSVIAWQKYNIFAGILDSEWVGWQNFINMVRYYNFTRILRNSLIIGLYKIIFTFPAPLILALLLNEVQSIRFKRSVQTLVYMPHFLSWVVVSGIFINILSPQGGAVNIVLEKVFGMESIFFMGKERWFRPVVVISSIWKESGFESIIYLAGIAAISNSLYEAASIDGASRWQQLRRITLPSLLPTIVILLLLRVGRFLEIGFDQIYTLANPLVWSVADIFDTYVYRKGLLDGAYSITTAVNLFKTVVGFVLLMGANTAAKRATGRSLF
jgi:putative aldouronate transport system permease protein